ncbi:DNA-binding protein [Pantoea sp. Eser]|nr:DNA-binding protein [Pantoea sp. Eser]
MMNRKEDLVSDWHSEDVIRELHKRGLSLAELSRRNGYAAGSLKSVLRTKCRSYQEIVAAALEVAPEDIWPSRYQTKSYMRKAS